MEKIVNHNLQLIYDNDPHPVNSIEFLAEADGIYFGIPEVVELMEVEDLIEHEGPNEYYLTTQGYETVETGGWGKTQFLDPSNKKSPDPLTISDHDPFNITRPHIKVPKWIIWMMVLAISYPVYRYYSHQGKIQQQQRKERLKEAIKHLPYEDAFHLDSLADSAKTP